MTRHFLRVSSPQALKALLEAIWELRQGRIIVSPPAAGDQVAYLAFDVGDPGTVHQLTVATRRLGLIPMSPVPPTLVARHPNALFLVTSDCYAHAKILALRAAATLSVQAARPASHQLDRIVAGLWANMNGRPSEGDVLLDRCRIL